MMSQVADLIKAVAALLWPVLGFAIVFLFKGQIRELLHRLKKGKLFGQELELEASLERLNASATAAASELGKLPETEHGRDDSPQQADDESKLISLAATSPKTALLELSSLLEREARNVLAATGHLRGRTNVPLRDTIAEMDANRSLPAHVSGSLKQFWEVRNRIVHGHGATEDDVLSALDSGMAILRALRAIPRETHTVIHPGVPIYADREAKVLIPDAKGVILESTSLSGVRKRQSIFPTTKDHFKKGQQVAWEWSFGRTWRKTWYRDPVTSEIRQAWDSSVEFVGRPLDNL
jgi:hypothetical protein